MNLVNGESMAGAGSWRRRDRWGSDPDEATNGNVDVYYHGGHDHTTMSDDRHPIDVFPSTYPNYMEKFPSHVRVGTTQPNIPVASKGGDILQACRLCALQLPSVIHAISNQGATWRRMHT